MREELLASRVEVLVEEGVGRGLDELLPLPPSTSPTLPAEAGSLKSMFAAAASMVLSISWRASAGFLPEISFQRDSNSLTIAFSVDGFQNCDRFSVVVRLPTVARPPLM